MFGSRTSWNSGRYISTFGSRKICISFGNLEDENDKTESWWNTYCGVNLKKMRFVPGGFSCTNPPTSCTWRKVVDGCNRNIVSLPKHHIRFSRVFADLMRPIVRNTECDPLIFYNTCWCDPLFFTTPPISSTPNWLNGSKGREFNLWFRNSVFCFPGIIKWKRPKESKLR